MITPRFSCRQTDETVIVSCYCPSIRAADVEIDVDETLVTIHVNPYFLRLNFTKPLLEDDDDSSANYDPSSGYLTIYLTKKNRGDVFEDLDLLAKLLAPRKTTQATPTIEVLSSETLPEDDLVTQTEALSLEQNELFQAAENDWQLLQEVPSPLPAFNMATQVHYGFLNLHHNYLKHATHTENEINELADDAEVITEPERQARREQHEKEKWDEEHYMADFMDDEYIRELLHWEHPYICDHNPVQYTEKENLAMLRLPRKEYLVTDRQTHDLYLTLISLLFSYCYDSRTTQHDPTPESAWTMCNLTPAFTALDPPRSSQYTGGSHIFSAEELQEAILPSYRRSLIFPLYRSYILSEKCRKDVAALLKKGKRTVVRCLLEMKDILDHHEVYYIYSKIWLDDFCVWMQAGADDGILVSLGETLMGLKLDKDSIGLNLEELEKAALSTLERESDSDDESISGDDSES